MSKEANVMLNMALQMKEFRRALRRVTRSFSSHRERKTGISRGVVPPLGPSIDI